MSISGSLHTALSGLHAVSRAAEVVSSNISNAMTEGYGKREVLLSSEVLAGQGSGVRVDGIRRHSDPALTGNRRLSEAQLARVEVRAEFLSTLETAIGMPDAPGSLSARMTEFESALIASASRPDSEARQVAVEIDLVGLACVEFFETAAGEVMVNEIAPRPHNSGHLTIEACEVSQFRQQALTVAGHPAAAMTAPRPAAMANLLGDLWQTGEPRWEVVEQFPGHPAVVQWRQSQAEQTALHLAGS